MVQLAYRRSDDHIIALRRKAVSSARLRGMNCHEIVALLAEQDIINPRTELPYSIVTISNDLKAIEEMWKEETLKEISYHRTRVLAELQEVKRTAWTTGKHAIILRAIDQEVSLLGLNELERMGVEIALANLLKGFPKQIADQLKKVLAVKVAEKKKRKKLEHEEKASVIDINRASS